MWSLVAQNKKRRKKDILIDLSMWAAKPSEMSSENASMDRKVCV